MTKRLLVAVIAMQAAWLGPVLPRSAAEEPSICGVPRPGGDGWPVSAENIAAIDPRPLCRLIEKLDTSKIDIHGIVVVRGGSLVFEHYRDGPDERWGVALGSVAHGPEVKHDVRSVSKSVVSLLTGIALDRELIASIDEPVFGFFPEYARFRDAAKDRILLRHLLTMSAGFAWDENVPYSDAKNSERQMIFMPEPYRYVLERPMASEPGKTWNYSGGCTALLGAVLQKAAGKPLAEFAREALFEPLGIADFEWVKMPSGDVSAASGLRLRPRDMAKLGQLVLSHGEWRGKRIVSAGWLNESVKKRFDVDDLGYGYQWWTTWSRVGGRTVDWFEAYGLGGQRIVVIPSLDAVVVLTTGLYRAENAFSATTDILDDFILPALAGH